LAKITRLAHTSGWSAGTVIAVLALAHKMALNGARGDLETFV
jgi:hypothetical protein